MEVRVAAASAAGTLPPELSDEVLSTLLEDGNIGVRKIAVKSVSGRNGEAVKLRVRDMVRKNGTPDCETSLRSRPGRFSPGNKPLPLYPARSSALATVEAVSARNSVMGVGRVRTDCGSDGRVWVTQNFGLV